MYSIMIVDDNETELVIAQKTLQDNYRVIPMNNPKSALTRLSKATVPDKIILDVDMPVINGFEMMTRIRTSDKTKNVPVIFYRAMLTMQQSLSATDLVPLISSESR